MNIVFAGAMISIMALCVFGAVLPLGSVNPELAFPFFLGAVLLAVLWSGWLLFSSQATWKASPMHWPVLGFILYAVIRYFFSPLEYEARIELFHIGLCGFVYFLCATQFHRPADRMVILICLMVLAVFEASYGTWQAFSKSDAIFGWMRPEGYRGRGSGTLICPNHYAGLLELILGLVIARVAFVRRESPSLERSMIIKVLMIYVVLMVVAGIVLSFSRAGWVSAAVGMCLLILVGDWRSRFGWPRIALGVVVLGLMAFMMWKFDPVRDYLIKSVKVDERSQALSLSDPTVGGRTLMWKGTLQIIRDHPLFGTGGGSWQWVYQRYKAPSIHSRPEFAHNDYLNLLSDYGLVGFVLVAAVFVGFFRQAFVLGKPTHPPEVRAFAIGSMLSVAAILVHSWFDSNLHIPGVALVLAVILGFTAAMDDAGRKFPRVFLQRFPRYSLAAALLIVSAVAMWNFIPTALATRYTDFGNRLKKDLNYDLALAYYDYAVQWDPKAPEPYAGMGDVFRTWATWRLGEEKKEERRELALQGIAAYDESVKLNPHQSFVLLNKARLHEIAGQKEEALKSLEAAVAVYPTNPLAYFLLGCFFRDNGEPERARKAFAESERIHYTFAARLNTIDLESPPPPPP